MVQVSPAGLHAIRWRFATILSIIVGALSCYFSCSSIQSLPPEVFPPSKPAISPQDNDSSFTITGLRKWYLTENEITADWQTIRIKITSCAASTEVDAWIDSTYAGRFSWINGTAELSADLSAAMISTGVHVLLLAQKGADTGFFADTFYYSAPYCITVSNDWDMPSSGADFDSSLVKGNTLHERHPNLVMTHFAAPYAFTDTAISPNRKLWLAGWLKAMRDEYSDEIGLHIHPYCHFLSIEGVVCKTDSSFYGAHDSTGYLIGLSRYSEADAYALFAAADSVFNLMGLGKPVSFRAGGWAAGLHTLKALVQDGFLVDASGCNYSLGEEFNTIPLWQLLADSWPNINNTSQPYYPSITDINSANEPQLAILEAPDNGILADYADSLEMIAIFHENWDGKPLSGPRHFSIGYHPDSFGWTFPRLDYALSHIDQYLAAADLGPVVYVRMKDLAQIWK